MRLGATPYYPPPPKTEPENQSSNAVTTLWLAVQTSFEQPRTPILNGYPGTAMFLTPG